MQFDIFTPHQFFPNFPLLKTFNKQNSKEFLETENRS